jgi:hypothetical protein
MDKDASWCCVIHCLKITSWILKLMHTSKFESLAWHYNVSSVDVYISHRLTDVLLLCARNPLEAYSLLVVIQMAS